jgi:hypothetical protein
MDRIIPESLKDNELSIINICCTTSIETYHNMIKLAFIHDKKRNVTVDVAILIFSIIFII